MGNATCCRNDIQEDKAMDRLNEEGFKSGIKHKAEPIKDVDDQYRDIEEPKLPPRAQATIDSKRFFVDQLNSQINPQKRRYGQDIYVGDLDEKKKKPHGLGIMYKQNGGVYIGSFNHGKAQGRGAFVFPDGAYYEGEFYENVTDDTKGMYKSDLMTYNGGFKNNTFHGDAEQEGRDYKFIGSYSKGARTQGTLTWEFQGHNYKYDGEFNTDNEFQGKGTLTEPTGEYKGDFVFGQKHGRGTYDSRNGFRYEGTYSNGQRDGVGTIYNSDNTIFYKGEIDKNLPHGKGSSYASGTEVKSTWVEGIDYKELPGK